MYIGLLKGSTTALDGIGRAMPAERPKTLSRRLAGVYAAEPDAVEARSPRPAPPHDSAPSEKSLAILSPFDEQEEWAKISEIMASFGSRLVRESVFVSELEQEFRAKLAGAGSDGDRDSRTSSASLASLPPVNLTQWLATIGLPHYETTFLESGYDELDFINGIIDENDLQEMGIDETDRPKILESVKQLPLKIAEIKNPTANHHDRRNHNNNNQTKIEESQSVEDWLKNICLEQYADTFRRHLYVDMDRVKRIWEVELTAVLEILKTGHRKRILSSVSEQQNGSNGAPLDDINADLNNLENNIQQLKEEIKEKLPADSTHIIPPKPAPLPIQTLTVLPGGETLKRSKKNRPAPQPPSADFEIRAPSELLVGVPGALKTQWRHQPLVLITGAVTYVAKYLGSTLVKELRGTESTKKSIQKLKKSTKEPRDSPDIILSITYRGVKFLNTITRELICEHEIRNIHCACQDADDLTHFAYLTRDHAATTPTATHYCHVFCVATMDQATEVILTLGEAFEVAYQMALRENCNKSTLQRTQAKTPTHDSSTGSKEKTNTNHGRSHSITEIKLNGHQLKLAPIPSSISNEDFQLTVKNGDTGSRSPKTPILKAPIASTEEL